MAALHPYTGPQTTPGRWLLGLALLALGGCTTSTGRAPPRNRAHASIVGPPPLLPHAGGRLLHREVEVLSKLLADDVGLGRYADDGPAFHDREVDGLALSDLERARAGLFLAMQYPVEIPGVSVSNFLRTAKTAIAGEAPALRTWIKDVRGAMDALKMDNTFTERNVNEGFSGGEKKRHEILQLELLKPKFAVLDETDSGLDVDALKIVSEGVNRAKEANDFGLLLITHYTRILKYIKPDFVHVFVAGKIAEQGGPELADRLEAEGYDRYVKA